MLPGDARLKDAPSDFRDPEEKTALKEILEDLNYDIILIDAPPGDSVLYDMIYIATDYIIVVSDASPEALAGIAKMQYAVNQYRKEGLSSAVFLGSLLCRVKMAFGNARHKLKRKEVRAKRVWLQSKHKVR